MKKLTIMRGLPASGKSTYAKSVASRDPQNTLIVSRDSIRRTVFNETQKTVLNHKLEQRVTKLQEALVTAALEAGRHVIIDDTNLRARYARRWATLAHSLGAPYEVVSLKKELHDLHRLNDRRPKEEQVPQQVITDLWNRFPQNKWPEIKHDEPKPEPIHELYVPNYELPPAYVFDIDGTLAVIGGRDPYDASRAMEDESNFAVAEVMLNLLEANNSIILLTGRQEKDREVTEEWLYHNYGFSQPLFMRETSDQRPDWLVKSELFDTCVAPYYNVQAVFDDRDSVVKMWRERGITCFQVNYGDF